VRRAGALAVLVLLAAACGGEDDHDRLTVFAAASLTDVLRPLEPEARFNFAGSDELATQIREGAQADVFASASTRYPDELRREGLVERPRVFATNRLVLVASAAWITSLADVAKPGVKLVVAAAGVPAGDYTRRALTRLGASRVLRNVVSEEEDVRSVLGKVELGEADAGFVYATDARSANGLRAVELPAAARTPIAYSVAVVADSRRRAEAERFVAALMGERARRALRRAGFGLP
jgi:molybdate transport system substrate-binding protein